MVKYDDPAFDAVFRALGDSTRRAFLDRLRRGEASLSELAALSGLSLQGTAKHIQVLAQAGLVAHEKAGRVRRCWLRPEALRLASDLLGRYRIHWSDRLDGLDDLFASRDGEETTR